MTTLSTLEGAMTHSSGKYALVVGRWNSFVVEHLLEGAVDCLRRHGVSDDNITVIRVPGAYEIPLAAQARHVRCCHRRSGRFSRRGRNQPDARSTAAAPVAQCFDWCCPAGSRSFRSEVL